MWLWFVIQLQLILFIFKYCSAIVHFCVCILNKLLTITFRCLSARHTAYTMIFFFFLWNNCLWFVLFWLDLFALKIVRNHFFSQTLLANSPIYWFIKYLSNINNVASSTPSNSPVVIQGSKSKVKDMPTSNNHHRSQTKTK